MRERRPTKATLDEEIEGRELAEAVGGSAEGRAPRLAFGVEPHVVAVTLPRHRLEAKSDDGRCRMPRDERRASKARHDGEPQDPVPSAAHVPLPAVRDARRTRSAVSLSRVAEAFFRASSVSKTRPPLPFKSAAMAR